MDFYFGDQIQKEDIVYFGKSDSLCVDVNWFLVEVNIVNIYA